MIHAWDISTSIIGHCEFDEDGSFRHANHCDLRKIQDWFEKLEAVQIFLERCVTHGALNYIEDRLGNFAFGKTMMQTLMKLAAFNSTVSWMIHKKGHGPITYIHPSTVKAIMKSEGLLIPKGADKKKLTLAYVRNDLKFDDLVELNRKGNPQPWCYDMADAYIVGKAGMKKFPYAKGT